MKQNIKIIILFFFPLLTAIATFIVLYIFLLSSYDSSSNETKLIIVNDDMKQTGKILESENIIKHWWSVFVINKVRSLNYKINPGEYEFSPSMTPLQIIKKINNGEFKVRSVTINAGETLEQIVDSIANAELANKQEIEESVYNKEFVQNLGVPSGNLEGYLCPNQYNFIRPITVQDIFSKILKECNNRWLPTYNEITKILKLDRRQILTLASIIEKECIELGIPKNTQTLRNMSAVFHNRLKKQMPLNAASTIYFINKNASRPLTDEDKNVLSPFNTFINTGLPPSPIGNPSYDAIKAVLYPTSEKYISYTFDEKTKGISFEN